MPADPAEQARYEAAFARFCAVFPDVFYRSERGRMHFNREKERRDKGRFLTAGFHNSAGYFRDDIPLCELILDDAGRREIDELWRELDLVADAPMRQHADFIFYEPLVENQMACAHRHPRQFQLGFRHELVNFAATGLVEN